MLTIENSKASPFYEDLLKVEAYIKEHHLSFTEDLILKAEDKVVLKVMNESISKRDFEIELISAKLLWRLNHSGKNSEAVCRAVMGKLDRPIVFDATAGLGRESLILQSAGCSVFMFERNPVIWLLLKSAVAKALACEEVVSSLKNGLPTLTALGSYKDQLERGEPLLTPEVIYYDPMFPERKKSALVKKEMRVFHELVGFDEDTTDYAEFLLTKASHHLVVKRPANEPPLKLSVRRSSFVDGKACRFDCYYTGS